MRDSSWFHHFFATYVQFLAVEDPHYSNVKTQFHLLEGSFYVTIKC